MLPTRDSLQLRGTQRLNMMGQKKIFYASGNQKRAGVAILMSDKIGFKPKTVKRNKDGHIRRGSIHQEDVAIIKSEYLNTLSKCSQIQREKQTKCNSRALQYLTFINGQIIQTENQQRYVGLEPCFRPTGTNRYIQNIPSNSSRKHISSQAHMKHPPEQITC